MRFGPKEAIALLRRGDRAERVAIYSGVKVIRAPDRCKLSPDRRSGAGTPAGNHVCRDYERSVRIWHGGPGLTRLEFVGEAGDRSRAGAGRNDRKGREAGGPVPGARAGVTPGAPVVVENGPHRWFFSPRQQRWRPISWQPPEPRLDLMLKNYRVIPGSLDRVAGRLALQIRIEPRHPGNPRKHSWHDLATGIALRSDLYDHGGNLVSTAGFRHFRTEASLPPSLFQAAGASDQGHREGVAGSRQSFEALLPQYLPPGYVLERVSRPHYEGTEVVRARFTDGLNVLSLVQWKGRRDLGERGGERFWAPGERVRRSIGSIHSLLAGDLTAAELQRISASIRSPKRESAAVVTHK